LKPGLWQIQLKRIKVTQGAASGQILLDHHYSGGPLFNPQVEILNLSNGWFVDGMKDKQMTEIKRIDRRNIQSIVLAKFRCGRIAANSAAVRGTICGGLRGF
jgi:hypothetical protein